MRVSFFTSFLTCEFNNFIIEVESFYINKYLFVFPYFLLYPEELSVLFQLNDKYWP